MWVLGELVVSGHYIRGGYFKVKISIFWYEGWDFRIVVAGYVFRCRYGGPIFGIEKSRRIYFEINIRRHVSR
jgi:hypothetical protein